MRARRPGRCTDDGDDKREDAAEPVRLQQLALYLRKAAEGLPLFGEPGKGQDGADRSTVHHS